MTQSRSELRISDQKNTLFRDAEARLFRPGVQMRMILAILLCIFTALFPLMLSLGGFLVLIPFEIFVTAPMLYGLFAMARKAANEERILIEDLFAGFSRLYWYSIVSVFFALLLFGIPLALYAFCVYGAVVLCTMALQTSVLYAVAVLIFGIMVCVLAVLPVLFMQIPAYLFLTARVKYPKLSILRAMRMSCRLLTKDLAKYLKLRLRFLWLALLSCLSVCALFPIYTLPVMLIANAKYLDRLTENEE